MCREGRPRFGVSSPGDRPPKHGASPRSGRGRHLCIGLGNLRCAVERAERGQPHGGRPQAFQALQRRDPIAHVLIPGSSGQPRLLHVCLRSSDDADGAWEVRQRAFHVIRWQVRVPTKWVSRQESLGGGHSSGSGQERGFADRALSQHICSRVGKPIAGSFSSFLRRQQPGGPSPRGHGERHAGQCAGHATRGSRGHGIAFGGPRRRGRGGRFAPKSNAGAILRGILRRSGTLEQLGRSEQYRGGFQQLERRRRGSCS
mmetsp:Transcript_72344/g.157084  ORF Transcript_72344/g.157084 Transcript_72344/m.157084 type:complete len:258 (-) Transcript_72344:687-1460(-)